MSGIVNFLPHQRGILFVIRLNGGLDHVLVVAVLILLDINAGDKLHTIQIGKALDAARTLRLWRVVCRMDVSCRVQDGALEAAPDMGPLRALGTGQANQPENHAFGKRSFQNGELGVEIDRTGLVGTGLSALSCLSSLNGHPDIDPKNVSVQSVLKLKNVIGNQMTKVATKPKAAKHAAQSESQFAKPHQLMLMSTAQNAGAMEKFSVYGEVDMQALITELQDRVKTVQDGDAKPLEAKLYGQALALQSIFTNMARRSALNAGEYINASETYMKLALRAQAQCRATLETLAFVKNPMPYIKQANIANGPQQVNNGQPAPAQSHAGNSNSQQSKLLESDNGQFLEGLDARTAVETSASNQTVATMGQVNGAEVTRG